MRTVLIVAVALAGLTACASAPGGTAAPAASASASAKTGTGTVKRRPVCDPATTESKIRATSEDFKVGATVKATLEVKNTSSTPCRLRGWLKAKLLNTDLGGGDVAVERAKTTGPAKAVVLMPDGTATEALQWQQCDDRQAECHLGNIFEVCLPGCKGAETVTMVNFPEAAKVGIHVARLIAEPVRGASAS